MNQARQQQQHDSDVGTSEELTEEDEDVMEAEMVCSAHLLVSTAMLTNLLGERRVRRFRIIRVSESIPLTSCWQRQERKWSDQPQDLPFEG